MESKLNKRNLAANIRIVVSIKDEFPASRYLTSWPGRWISFLPGVERVPRVKKKGKSAAAILNDYIFRNFNPANKSILSAEELAGIFHFPHPI